MIYNLILACVLIISFLLCVSAYVLGVKHGKQLSNGIVPQYDVNPVKAVERAVEQVQAEKERKEFENQLESLDVEKMLKQVAKERAEGRE